jgi:hypothetical protein
MYRHRASMITSASRVHRLRSGYGTNSTDIKLERVVVAFCLTLINFRDETLRLLVCA